MKPAIYTFAFVLLALHAQAQPAEIDPPTPPKLGPVVVHSIVYDGKLSDAEARFTTKIEVECTNQVETALSLFSGNVAVFAPKLPAELRLLRAGDGYLITVIKPGKYTVELDVLAKITKADPWRSVSFTGPSATIATISGQVTGTAMDLELLSGTPLPRPATERSTVRGALGAERTVSLRWQSRAEEQARKVILTSTSSSTVHIAPALARYQTHIQYEILQGKPSNLILRLPASQTITKITGQNIRDWRVATAAGIQTLTVDFAKPAERSYDLTVLSEETTDAGSLSITPPQPLGVEREAGTISITAEDVIVETSKIAGLRQINAVAGTVAAYQFFGRDTFQLDLKRQRVEPVIKLSSFTAATLEENRLILDNRISVLVEKAGIYQIELTTPPKFTITDVQGEGVAPDWKLTDGKIMVQFRSRVLGSRLLTIKMEQPLPELPKEIELAQVRAVSASKNTALMEIGAVAGLQLKTATLTGMREVPVTAAQINAGRLLAYASDQGDWVAKISVEKLAPRVIAEVVNLISIGDGIIGGAANIRYGVFNQGVKEFKVAVPEIWKNVDFIGKGVRRRDPVTNAVTKTVDWTIALQDKVWGSYTLTITYDEQFTETSARLPLPGAHAIGVEREAGYVAISKSASLDLKIDRDEPNSKETVLERVDEAALPAAERDQLERAPYRVYKYDNNEKPFKLEAIASRLEASQLLAAVADRNELTTEITDAGQMLTKAVFKIKNTRAQHQHFTLPPGSQLWSSLIDGQPVKPERISNTEDKYLIPLPLNADRNRALSVELVYAQKLPKPIKRDSTLSSAFPVKIKLTAPVTDIPNTYNVWNVHVPKDKHLFDFDGNMVVEHQREYSWMDAWNQFVNYYRYMPASQRAFFVLIGMALFVISTLVLAGLRKGWRGVITGTAIYAGIFIICLIVDSPISPLRENYKSASDSSPKSESKSEPSDSDGGWFSRESSQLGASPTRPPSTPAPNVSEPPNELAQQQSAKEKKEAPMNRDSSTETKSRPSGAKGPNFGGGSGGPGGVSGGGGMGGFGGDSSPAKKPAEGTDGLTSTTAQLGDNREKNKDAITATGIRSVQIDTPKSGRVYNFTKVLSVSGDGNQLNITANIINMNGMKLRRGFLQLLVLLVGIGIYYSERKKPHPSPFNAALGISLAVGAILWVLLIQRWLHVPLILLPPAAFIVFLVCMAIKCLPLLKRRHATETPPVIPSAAIVLIIATLGAMTAQAQPAAIVLPASAGVTRAYDPLNPFELLPPRPDGQRLILESFAQDRNGIKFEVNHDEPYTGWVVGFYQNRQKRIESQYKAGRLDGSEITWYDNGQKSSETQHTNGVTHGLRSTWYRMGNIQQEIRYVSGKLHGISRSFFVNGKIQREESFKAGQPDGLARTYYANGKVESEIRWADGRQVSFDVWDSLGIRMGDATNAVSLITAKYTLALQPQVAVVDAELQFNSTKDKQRFVLFREVLAIDKFTASQPGIQLLREGNDIVISLPTAGPAKVDVRFLVKPSGEDIVMKATGEITRRNLSFGIPPALTSTVEANLNEPDTEFELPTAVIQKTETIGLQTKATATIGASNQLELSWKPRIKKAEEIVATVFCQNSSLLSFGGGVIQLRSKFDYTISQGELRRARIQIPGTWKLMRVEPQGLRTWSITPDGTNSILIAELNEPAKLNFRIGLDLEQALPAPPASPQLTLPQVLDVKRETGLLGIQTSDELGVAVESGSDLIKIDAAEVSTAMGTTTDKLAVTYRVQKIGSIISTKIEALKPLIEADAYHQLLVGEEQLSVTSAVNYHIKRVGIFQLQLLIPAGFRIDQVIGANIAQWVEKTENNQRILLVQLSHRTSGEYPLVTTLSKRQTALAAKLDVEAPHAIDASKLTSYLSVITAQGVQVKTGNLTGLVEIPTQELARSVKTAGVQTMQADHHGQSSLLAYKHLATQTNSVTPWKLAIGTEMLTPWVRTETVNWINVRDNLITGRSQIRYAITNAPTRAFKLRVPKGWKNVEIVGENIRRRDQKENDWTIELQQKRIGTYTLSVTWEFPWSPVAGDIVAAGVQTQGIDPDVERETGWIAAVTRSRLQLATSSIGPTVSLRDAQELPEWFDRAGVVPSLVYSYLRPEYQLSLKTERYQEAGVLEALAHNARIVSVVSPDGQMMSHVSLALSNQGRPFLEVVLPSKAINIMSVFVAGQAVRPTIQKDKLFIPIERTLLNEKINVEFVYTHSVKFPKNSGDVSIESPKFNVPLQSIAWQLRVPRDYKYTDFKGTVSLDESQRVANLTFSESLYTTNEEVLSNKNREEIASNLRLATENFKSGKLSDANRQFNLAQRLNTDNNSLSKGEDDMLKGQLRDVRRGQAKQLQDAELSYRNDNQGRFLQQPGQSVAPNPEPQLQKPNSPGEMAAFDEVAEQQVLALQRAQEISTARVTPLRVNVPAEGYEYHFTQTLQTEINEPLKLNFKAANLRKTNWTLAILIGLAGFILAYRLAEGQLAKRRNA